jgi:hypothetical protein
VALARRVAVSGLFAVIVAVFVPVALACTSGSYTYAGLAGQATVSGVGARITPAASGFNVAFGHVAGWVGVGGPGMGPNGTDEWIQVGLSAFPQWTGNDVYYEVAQPDRAPVYRRVFASIAPGLGMRLAVLEMRARRDWWRVWVDGAPVSAPIFLPSSHSRWRPVVTGESWDGGQSACNDFVYRFDAIRIANHPGGLWSPLHSTDVLDNVNTIVKRRAPGAFDAAGGVFGLRTLADAGSTEVAAAQP